MKRFVPVSVVVLLLSAQFVAAQFTPPVEATVLKTLRPQHPRLYLLPDDLARLKQLVATDKTAKGYAMALAKRGEAMLTMPPVSGSLNLDKSRTALNRIATLALCYRLDGNKKWANRAIVEMKAACALANWHPDHFLDVAEMTTAVAIGYDWLYDAMTPEERKLIRQGLVDKGLREGEKSYRRKTSWARIHDNWNNVNNGGLIVGALAVADEEPALAAYIITQAASNLPDALQLYAPDGAWPEGPGYWEYATKYTLYSLHALRSALGTDFGLSTFPGMPKTGQFILYTAGCSDWSWNYADGSEGHNLWYIHAQLFGLSRLYDQPLLAALAREGAVGHEGEQPFALVWYRADGDIKRLTELPRDFVTSGDGAIASFRGSWTDWKAMFVGLRGGRNGVNHGHLDLGSFELQSHGQRWALDLDADNYSRPGYFGARRWTYYRLINAGHNTLTLDGKNQDTSAMARFSAHGSTDDGGFAIVDLTAAYGPSGASAMKRGVRLFNQRQQVLVQDEIETKGPVGVVWALHTGAKITLDAGGTHATFAQKGYTLKARLLSPAGATFAVEDVIIPPPQRPAPGISKLLIRLPEKTAKACLAVDFAPGGVTVGDTKITPLAEWK